MSPLILTNVYEKRSTSHSPYEESKCLKKINPLFHSHIYRQQQSQDLNSDPTTKPIVLIRLLFYLSVSATKFLSPLREGRWSTLRPFSFSTREFQQKLIDGSDFLVFLFNSLCPSGIV